jgi:hypothetical protein
VNNKIFTRQTWILQISFVSTNEDVVHKTTLHLRKIIPKPLRCEKLFLCKKVHRLIMSSRFLLYPPIDLIIQQVSHHHQHDNLLTITSCQWICGCSFSPMHWCVTGQWIRLNWLRALPIPAICWLYYRMEWSFWWPTLQLAPRIDEKPTYSLWWVCKWLLLHYMHVFKKTWNIN